jgi:hypothetical protein
MTFDDTVEAAIDLLHRRGRVSHRALKRQFELDDAFVADLIAELVDVLSVAVDDGATLTYAGPLSPVPVLDAPAPTTSFARLREPTTTRSAPRSRNSLRASTSNSAAKARRRPFTSGTR